MSRLIGICGYARSGKDTAAEALVEDGWTRVAFADALKEDVINAVVRSLEAVYHDNQSGIVSTLFAEKKETFRPLLVEYGRAMRNIVPGYWIDRASTSLEACSGANVVVTDVRYANEARWIRSKGGIVISVSRVGVPAANNEEATSLAMFAPDYTIANDYTTEHLHDRIRDIVSRTGVQ